MKTVTIHYHRPPARDETYVQRLVHADDRVIVTLNELTPIARPIVIDGRVVLEHGSPAVWFTFPDMHFDIGRFHRADGAFTGIYTNILTPVRFLDDRTWETTDLFLDIWLDLDGRASLLDEPELEEAVRLHWIDEATAAAARAEAGRILGLARAGAWPPAGVEAWTLERVRQTLAREA